MIEVKKPMVVSQTVQKQLATWRANILDDAKTGMTIGNGDLNHLFHKIKEADGQPWLSERSGADHFENNEKIMHAIAYLEGQRAFTSHGLPE